jgi:hypothetical protein
MSCRRRESQTPRKQRCSALIRTIQNTRWGLIETFLTSYFSGTPRLRRRVSKVQALEDQMRENRTPEDQEVGA